MDYKLNKANLISSIPRAKESKLYISKEDSDNDEVSDILSLHKHS